MPHCEAIADFDFLAIFASDAEEGANYALLVGVAAKGVVEDGEDSLFPKLKDYSVEDLGGDVLEAVLSRLEALLLVAILLPLDPKA